MEHNETEQIQIRPTGAGCPECRYPRGHRDDCSIGKKELEEWKKLFGGRGFDQYNEDDQPKNINVFTPIAVPDFDARDEDVDEALTLELPKKLEPFRMVLVNDVIKFAYNFATDKGKYRLEDVFRAKKEKTKDVSKLLSEDVFQILKKDVKAILTEEERAKHFEGMKQFIDKEFNRVHERSKMSDKEWRHIIFDLIKNLEMFCGDIENRDEGALKMIKSLIAKMFLSEKDLLLVKDNIS